MNTNLSLSTQWALFLTLLMEVAICWLPMFHEWVDALGVFYALVWVQRVTGPWFVISFVFDKLGVKITRRAKRLENS